MRHWPVKVCDGDDLSADVVVESVNTVRVDETVPDPAASVNHLLRLTDHLRGASQQSDSHHSTMFVQRRWDLLEEVYIWIMSAVGAGGAGKIWFFLTIHQIHNMLNWVVNSKRLLRCNRCAKKTTNADLFTRWQEFLVNTLSPHRMISCERSIITTTPFLSRRYLAWVLHRYKSTWS